MSMSPLSPFLALRIPYVQDIIKYRAREIDVLVVLLLDGIVESVNQLLLVGYFAMYINKTGLDATNVLSMISNAAGALFKLLKVLHMYIVRRKESIRLSTVSSSPTSSSTIDTFTEKTKESLSSPPVSVDMINMAYNINTVKT